MILKVDLMRKKVMVQEILVQVDPSILEMTVLTKKLKITTLNTKVVHTLQKETKEDDKDQLQENLVQDEEVVILKENNYLKLKKKDCILLFLLLNYNFT
jgi:exosome complex RNA-binding protein Rrp42 (RNase PH superfamily)